MPSPEDLADDAEPIDASLGAGLVGEVISGRYRIEQLLGEGGMGAVYLATHTLMRKKLAVKVLHPEMTRKAEIVARFEREAMAAAHIDHPNVASATDFGKLEDGSFFLVLEFVEGLALRESLFDGKMGVARSLHIAKQIAQALGRAHSLGIVHRDLKPENVMLVLRDGDPDFVKVLDFGIAKVPIEQLTGGQAETLTRAGMVFGTPEYMAPEQALGEEVDHRADLYALGVMLYEMLSGARPFEADSAVSLLGMQISQAPPALLGKVPASVEAIVMRLLEKQPAARFQGAWEVVEAIDACFAAESYATALPNSHLGEPNVAARRRNMKAAIGKQLSKFAKTPAILLVLGSVVLALMIALLVSSPDEAASSKDATALLLPTTPSSSELAVALDAGAEALVALVEKYPDDGDALLALASHQAEEGALVDSMATLERLFATPGIDREDPRIVALVLKALQSKEAMDAALAMLNASPSPQVADLLYQAVTTRGMPTRAVNLSNQALRAKEIREQASPALLVALDLRQAKSCPAKKSLMARAEEHGDARALAILRPLTSTTGCGFVNKGDCFSCLRDGSLARAIKAIEGREKSSL